MNNIYGLLFALPVLISLYSMGFGINIKKWYGWVQVLSGFLTGMLIGINLAEKMILGVVIALMTLWIGVVNWRRRHP